MIPANETVLHRRHPDLWAALAASPLKSNVDLEPSRRGPATLVWTAGDGRRRYVHSQVDPVGEAEKVATAALRNSSGKPPRKALLVGHGAGHEIRALSARVEELWVLVADLSLMAFVCERLDWSDLFESDRIRWLFGSPESVQKNLRELMRASSADVATVLHPPFIELLPEEFNALARAVDQLQRGRATEDLVEPIARENLRQNFRALSSPGVSGLFGIARGRPAVVVAAGPSLDSCLPQLRELAQVSYVIATDTVAEGLEEADVPPDLVVSVDPRVDSTIHFTDDRLLARSALVFTPTTCPDVVRRFEGRRFLAVPRSHFLLRPIEEMMAPKGLLMGGGSVTILATSLAAALEPAYVALAGADFGSERAASGRDLRFYSRLSSYLRSPRDRAARYVTSETTEHGILSAELRKTSRAPQATSPRLETYASEFRHFLRETLVPVYSLGPPALAGVRTGSLPCVRPPSPPVRPVPVPAENSDPAAARRWLEVLGVEV